LPLWLLDKIAKKNTGTTEWTHTTPAGQGSRRRLELGQTVFVFFLAFVVVVDHLTVAVETDVVVSRV
jgi:hypothetical protein